MAQFKIPTPFLIPYFDHGKNLSETIRNSSRRRNTSRISFVYRKIRNTLLFWLAWGCPLNSWRIKMHRWRGVHIGKNVYIGLQCVIDNAYPEYIYMEDDSSIANNVTVIAHANPYRHFEGIIEAKVSPVVLRKGSWASANSILLPGTDIGEYSIVSSGSVVSSRIPPYTLVVGNPAKKVFNYEKILTKKQSIL